jgi:hypothetical protein
MMMRGHAIAALSAVALFALAAGHRAALAQTAPPPICNDFPKLAEEAQKRGSAVSAAIKAKIDRKQICALMNTFIVAESSVVKFLNDNHTWCGVPAEALTASKTNHEKSLQFRTRVCSEEAPHTKPPSLSDAIKAPSVDTSKNTTTGRGTFDTLTGNPLAK